MATSTGYYTGSQGEMPNFLLSNNKVRFYAGRDLVIPVWAEREATISFQTTGGANVTWEVANEYWNSTALDWGSAISDITISDNGNTNQKIQYIVIDTTHLETGDTITAISNVGSGSTSVLTLEEITPSKYTPIETIFYNKFGAMQSVLLAKRNDTSLSAEVESYQANLMDFSSAPTYSVNKHQFKSLSVNGKESIKANTGFMNDDHNQVIKELLLSEQIWLKDSQVLPVQMKSKSVEYKTQLNDKLINYTLEFDYAFHAINNLR